MNHLRVAIMPMLLAENRALFQATYQRFMVPLGPLALASYLEALNLPIEILVHDDPNVILNFKPNVVGISSVSENFGHAQKIARWLKEKTKCFTVIGGPHFTSWPEFLPDSFDLGVVGEGELPLTQIIQTLLKKGTQSPLLRKIPGVVFNQGGKTLMNPRPPQIENLDTLPIPNRKRWVKYLGVPHIMTTRGCIYNCFFCAEPTIFKSYRQASPARIVEEIENILTHYPSTRHIRFYDDIFPVNKKRLRELCQLLEERKINQRLSFSCFIHARLVDEEVADLLKRMNFIFVQFGAETGSATLIKQLKPVSGVDLNQQAIDLFYKKGIRVGTTFIVGTPEETPEDLNQTYSFILKNREKLFDVEISPAVALPGTSLWEYAKKNHLVPEPHAIDWQVFRDPAHLCEFDLNHYIYLAKQIPKKLFVSTLKKMWNLIQEIHFLHRTQEFLRSHCMAGYTPVAFHPLNATSLEISRKTA